MSGLRIAALQLRCVDPDLVAAFYEAAFQAVAVDVDDGPAVMLGEQRIEFLPAPVQRMVPAPSNSTGFQHFAIVVGDMDEAYAHLETVPGWKAISRNGPERLPESSGGVQAFKFRDPDGHPLELIAFPPSSVPAPWREKPGLFLGIDHTAITVADTERSIAHYTTLGFTVASRGVNRGIEQARMDAVDDPVVEVTGLMPPGGAPPHLELLCYRQPGTTADARAADDVMATRIVLAGGGEAAGSRLDPDGHRLHFK